LSCRIKEVDTSHQQVKLTCKASELSSDIWEKKELEELKQREPYLVLEDEKAFKPKRRRKKPQIYARLVEHPLFQNISCEQAQEFLKDKEVGEVVLRPSRFY
jgi:transcription elongation factor SPT6